MNETLCVWSVHWMGAVVKHSIVAIVSGSNGDGGGWKLVGCFGGIYSHHIYASLSIFWSIGVW
jgi:hypothetical protein